VSTARSHTVTRLTNGTTYRFRVAARNAVGQSAWSAAVRAAPHPR
jgi:Fibronectin type III domain